MTNATGLAIGDVAAYRRMSVETEASAASPHRLIGMLLRGARDKIQAARGNLENGDISEKCANITWAISIIDGLKTSLNLEAGGEIAANLDGLYEYMIRTLTEANLHNDIDRLGQVDALLKEIADAWQGIG